MSMQHVDNQNITGFKTNDDEKSRRKSLQFASNEGVICFRLPRDLMQIAM